MSEADGEEKKLKNFQNEKKSAVLTYEQEIQKPADDELQRCSDDWHGDKTARFKKNLQEIFQKNAFKKFCAEKYADFTDNEKKEFVNEYIIRNSEERKYTQIYYDRDYQNNMRQHLISFFDIKMQILQDRKARGTPKSVTQEMAELLKRQGVKL